MRFLSMVKFFGIRKTILGWLALFLFRRWRKHRERQRQAEQPIS
jgi:hypothetical protein